MTQEWQRETEQAMRRIFQRLGQPGQYVDLLTPYEVAVNCEVSPQVAAVLILTARSAAIAARKAHDLSIAAFNA